MLYVVCKKIVNVVCIEYRKRVCKLSGLRIFKSRIQLPQRHELNEFRIQGVTNLSSHRVQLSPQRQRHMRHELNGSRTHQVIADSCPTWSASPRTQWPTNSMRHRWIVSNLVRIVGNAMSHELNESLLNRVKLSLHRHEITDADSCQTYSTSRTQRVTNSTSHRWIVLNLVRIFTNLTSHELIETSPSCVKLSPHRHERNKSRTQRVIAESCPT